MKRISKKQAKHFLGWMSTSHPHTGLIRWHKMTHKMLAYPNRILEPIGIDLDDFTGWAFNDRMFFRDSLFQKPDVLIRVVMHETRHIFRGRQWGWGKMNARYLVRWRRRDIEVDGYCGNLLVERWQGREPNWDRYADKLSRYMLRGKDIRKAVKKLRDYDRKVAQDEKKNHMFYCWAASGAEFE